MAIENIRSPRHSHSMNMIPATRSPITGNRGEQTNEHRNSRLADAAPRDCGGHGPAGLVIVGADLIDEQWRPDVAGEDDISG
ncbi:hypothetical protein [Amycolatopsis sp. WAC 04182]|uniref:hypothetical protein n=1 Tax=Amycolatopsis sp. WAC 04182 TaxID=2203198 RepID=UPI000F7B1CFA|nr:hypothetical protein [Amycolatopsis sp. WAC 04182]